MKKAILTILVISSLFATLNVKAQGCGTITACSAGPNTQTGFPVPDSIPCAVQGSAYSYSIPFKMYTTFNYLGLQVVDSMIIDTVYNLPCGLCWSLNKASHTYAANEVGCITITGTTNDAVGQYNLRLMLGGYFNGSANALQIPPTLCDAAGIKIWQRVAASSGSCTSVDTSASATDQVAASSCSQQAGINCSGGRYHNFVFSTVDSSTVTYSTANSTTLQMDIFQPHGDVVSQRPVIILAHGGSFTSGTRSDDPAVTLLCKNMAQRGYVTASIDYRLGNAINMASDSAYCLDEMAKAISDAKAAIRYFRQDAATTNTYKIDPNLIFGGGNSVGSAIFLHIGYIDSVNECPPALITALNNNGGFNGNSGNTGYSSQIVAAINLAGGLNSPALVSVGDIPSVNFQGDQDAVVPYYCADWEQGLIAVRLCGLGSLTPYYQAAGINYQNTIYPGQGHVPWDANDTELTQIDTVVANFLLPLVCTGGTQVTPPSVTIGNNQSVCSGTNVQLTATVTNGQTPYTYAWSSTGNSITCNNCQVASSTITQNSTFTVTVTDANNSTATASVSYTIGGAGSINISAAGPTTFCTGGSVVLSAGGGYTSYLWSTGNTAASITATQGGSYGVTVTNNSGCSSTGSISVTTAAPPTSQSIIGNPSITPFQNYTYIVSQVSGITYNWVVTGGAVQTGQGTNSVSIIWGSTGPYLVSLIQTSTGGCSDTSTLLVINSSCSLQIGLNVVSHSPVCTGDTVLLIASVSTNGAAYQWVQNGSLITGAVSDTLFATTSGNYQVSVAANGCTALSAVNTVSFLPAPIQPNISGNVNINGCNTQPVTLTLNNSYPSYSWSDGDATSTTTVTTSGSYTVTVTGSNGCPAVSAPYNLNLSIINPVDICIVSVDSATGKNIIIWNNPQLTAIDSFLVYKESSALNVFDEIGGVASGDFSTFIDVNSNPAQQADRYTLAELDSCGHLTLQSLPHQTIHLSINQGIGTTWNLIWNAYEGFVFPSYYIYRGATGGTLSQIATIAASSTSYTDLNPPAGTAFYQVGIENPNGCNPSRSSNYSQSVSNIVSSGQVGIQNVESDNIDMYSYNTNGQNVVRVINDNATAYGLRLYEISGRLVLDKPGRNTEETILPETLAKGVYIAEAYFTNGIMKKIKVVVR